MKRIVITQSITNRGEAESLATYLEDIAKEEKITPDVEEELARRIHNGDEKALDRLVRANLRFVVSVAKTYQNQGLPLGDLIAEGNLGLVTAARRFDETRGFKFISYAVWWIRQSILEALSEHARMIRLPHNQTQLLRAIRNIQTREEQNTGLAPSPAEIAEELDVPESRIRNLLAATTRNVSLDAPLVSDEDGGTLLDVMADTNAEATDSHMDVESLDQEIDHVFTSMLQPRDIYVLKHSFGIGCKEQSHDEIGMQLGLTRERVRQIRERALLKLRNSKSTRYLRAYC